MMYYIMHRTQLLLEPWQYETLKSMAERQRRSISDLVRQVLSDYLKAGQSRGRSKLEDIEGFFDDPKASGREHDEYLYRRRKRS
jgi:hypothetical protein